MLAQAQESALQSEEMRTQLEQVQQKLKLVREEVVENSISREKESFNARRAQVPLSITQHFTFVNKTNTKLSTLVL